MATEQAKPLATEQRKPQVGDVKMDLFEDDDDFEEFAVDPGELTLFIISFFFFFRLLIIFASEFEIWHYSSC